jgi:acyl carrier protein
MNHKDLEEGIVAVVTEILKREPTSRDGLLDRGELDSLTTMQVIEAVEKRYGIMVEPDEFTHENFNSVGAMATLVGRHCAKG